MGAERFAEEQAAVLGPLVDKLLTMMGAARDAFNRHSRASVQEMQNLREAVARDAGAMTAQLKTLIDRKAEGERPVLRRLLSILSRLEIIGENIGGMTGPVQKKIKDGVLFSDKAVIQTNYLFDQHLGLIRSVLDVIKTDNEFLKKYIAEESRKVVQACTDYATEHEERVIEGVCLPQAAPLFLAILDRMRTIGEHEMEIARLLALKGQ